MTAFRWGILATGNIASSMAEALTLVPGAELRAVASRRQASADDFAERWTVPVAYGSYDALLADPDIDIVYIATPNALHKDNILSALAAGKHVLCEKPLTTSAADTALCAEAARSAGLFLMEAMWTAFFPAMIRVRELIEEGAIGTLRHLTANFVAFRDPKAFPNLYDPGLGGGATLDLGVYPFAAALLLAGPVERAASCVLEGPTGVDEMAGVSAVHASGVVSQLSFGFRVDMPIAVRVVGDLGVLDIPRDFHRPETLHLTRGGVTDEISLPPLGRGYAHEAIEVQRCVRDGALCSAIWPPASSGAVASLVERVRHR
jgi:predicted dehydrogenase